MKEKTKKLVGAEVQEMADKMAGAYFSVKERLKPLEEELVETSTSIKQFGEEWGELVGKRKVVTTENYEVGYMLKEHSELDLEELRRLRPIAYHKVVDMVPVLNEKKLQDLIAKGKLTHQLLARCVKRIGEPVKSVYVRRKNEKGKK